MDRSCWHREMLLTALVTLFYISRTEGQLVVGTNCPDVTPAAGLAAGSLTNTWFVQNKYFPVGEDHPLQCEKKIIGAPQAGTNTLSLQKSGRKFGVTVSLMGVATPMTPFTTYSVEYYGTPLFPTNYIVLGLGPDYVVLFSCTNFGSSFHAQQVLILTTAQFPPQATLDSAIAVVRANGIPPWLLTNIVQQGC